MKRVLIVDDSQFMRDILKQIISKIGLEVVGEAPNGVEALKKVQELKPDIMSMDITMPQMDGLKALKQIKSVDDDVKIIICSSLGQSYYIDKAISHGAFDYITKPFLPEKVAKVFQKAVDSSK